MTRPRRIPCPAPGCTAVAAQNGKAVFCRYHVHRLRACTLSPVQSSTDEFKITRILDTMRRGTKVFDELKAIALRYLRQNPAPEAEGGDPDAWMIDDDEP